MDLNRYIIEETVNTTSDNMLDKYPYLQNLNLWESNINKILYITGISGGGKGYLAKKIAKKYENTIIIELDKFENYNWYKDKVDDDKYVRRGDIIIFNWIKNTTESEFIDLDIFDNMIEKYNELLKRFMNYLIELSYMDYSHRYIVEGIQIFSDGIFKDIVNNESSIIILRTTKVYSIQKNLERDHAIIRNKLHTNNVDQITEINNLEKRIKGEYSQD